MPDFNTNIKELVREIYLQHREAIDLIIEHMPDFAEETREVFRQAVRSQPEWALDSETNALIRFRSADWEQFSAFHTGTGWGTSQSLLLFEIHIMNNPGPRLILVLGPSTDHHIREKIHTKIMANPGVFKNPNKSFTPSRTRLNTMEVITTSSHFEIANDHATRAQVEAWMNEFAGNQFPAMNEIIVDCLREYEAETQRQ